MRKTLLFFLVLFSFSIVAFGAEPQSQPKEIRFWQFWPAEWLAPEIKKFETETGYKVIIERLTWSEGLNKIITAMAANEAPDVIELGSTWVAGFSGSGGILPIQVGDLKEKLLLWRPATYNNQIYAVPWTLSTAALFYNKDLLTQAGVSPPTNFDELLSAAKKIDQLGPGLKGYGLKTGSYTTWQKFLPFVWSNGAKLIDEGQPQVTDPKFLEALGFYLALKEFSLFDDNIVVRKAFQSGQVGMMIEEPGQMARFLKDSPHLNFGVVPIPASPSTGQSVAFAGSQMLAIPKNTKNKEMALKLIRFLVRPDVTKSITNRITTLFPAYKGAELDPFYQVEHPELLVFLKSLQTATSPEAHPEWISIQEIFSENLERSLYGLVDPKTAMETAQRDIKWHLANTKPSVGVKIDPAKIPWVWLIGGPIALLILFNLLKARWKLEGAPHKKAFLLKEYRYNFNTFLFLLPWIFVFLLFSLFPIAYSIFMSFTRYRASGAEAPTWVGLDNYTKLLSDSHFIDALSNSLIFVGGTVPPILALALLLAVILNQSLSFRNFYRTAYFMPVVTSILVIATLFIELYAPQGMLNDLLKVFGIAPIHWLKDPNWALPSVMFMNIWASFGFYSLMLLAGLQNIPEEYYEASGLEGAGKLRQFFTITLPLLKPTLLVAGIMDLILAFQVFGEILVMTKGGPLRTTETAVYYLYGQAFHKQEMGYGSAAAYYIFVVLLLFSLGQFWLSREKKRAKD